MAKNRSAIVIMAKCPERGDVKTRLTPALGREERIALYTRLLDDTVKRLRDVKGADTFIAYTPADSGSYFSGRYGLPCFSQAGEGLGLRLSNSLEKLLMEGYMNAVAVGSDIPGLDAQIAQRALSSLRDKDLAIGPSTDGGYYLIGISKPRPELFMDVPWSTREVLKATLECARRMGLSTDILDILDDVDTPDDLKRLGMI